MKMDSFFKIPDSWKEIFVGFVSTVLGIAVTIGVDKKMEEAQAEEDKRNLTIMIIHDLDRSESRMKALVDTYRSYYEPADYVFRHLDQVSEISTDTLSAAFQFLGVDMELSRIQFPKMAENVLTSNMSNWTTLSNVQFMSNAEYCFALRRSFNEYIVPKEVYNAAHNLFQEVYFKYVEDKSLDMALLPKLITQLYTTDAVRQYIAQFEWVLSKQSEFIATIHQLNSENKWLMSVNSDDIQAYVKASSQRAPADRPRVTREALLGTWYADVEHEKGVQRYRKQESITFKMDNTYRIERKADVYQNVQDSLFTHTETFYGHWTLVGNDVRCVFDSISIVPTCKHADNVQLCEYLANRKSEIENDSTSTYDVLSDILIGDTDLSTVIYSEGNESETHLVHYIRK